MSEIRIPAPLNNYELFIFDLDGTLYDQKKLRKKLLIQLFLHLATRKIGFRDLKIINSFRRQRENHKSFQSNSLTNDQYQWVSEELGMAPELIAKTIDKWMFRFPLPYLAGCRYSGVKEFFRELRRAAKLIAIYSDFPAREKTLALQMEADMYTCSTDELVNQLKPSARGIESICKAFGIEKEKAIFIGDREDTDGESAALAGIDFIPVNLKEARSGTFYHELTKQLK